MMIFAISIDKRYLDESQEHPFLECKVVPTILYIIELTGIGLKFQMCI